MAQAERITTAIGELMSRGRPPKSTSPVRAAHTEFIAAVRSGARPAAAVPLAPIHAHDSKLGIDDPVLRYAAPLGPSRRLIVSSRFRSAVSASAGSGQRTAVSGPAGSAQRVTQCSSKARVSSAAIISAFLISMSRRSSM